MRKVSNLSAQDIAIAVARFPTIFAAAQRVAASNGEHCTREDFAKEVRRYDVEELRRVEMRFNAMPEAQRNALIKDLLK